MALHNCAFLPSLHLFGNHNFLILRAIRKPQTAGRSSSARFAHTLTSNTSNASNTLIYSLSPTITPTPPPSAHDPFPLCAPLLSFGSLLFFFLFSLSRPSPIRLFPSKPHPPPSMHTLLLCLLLLLLLWLSPSFLRPSLPPHNFSRRPPGVLCFPCCWAEKSVCRQSWLEKDVCAPRLAPRATYDMAACRDAVGLCWLQPSSYL